MLVAAEQDGEGVDRIDVEVGQQPDFCQDIIVQQVSFVDNEHGVNMRRVLHRQDVLLDGPEHGGASTTGAQSEKVTQVSVELYDADRSVAQVVALMQARLKAVFE